MTLKISRSQVSTQPNPPKIKKNSDLTQPNSWMDPTHDQLCDGPRRQVSSQIVDCLLLNERIEANLDGIMD